MTVCGLLVLLWLVFAPNRGFLAYHRLKKQAESLARENEALVRHNEELRREIERLQTDDVYLEELARQKYGLLKDNETVYQFK